MFRSAQQRRRLHNCTRTVQRHCRNYLKSHRVSLQTDSFAYPFQVSIRSKCRPPHNLRFQSKCRAPPSCLSSPSRSSCSTCPSSTSTACPLSWPLAQPNSARSSHMLRPTPRLFCALCATLGLRGILSPSFRRVLHFVTVTAIVSYTVCRVECLPTCMFASLLLALFAPICSCGRHLSCGAPQPALGARQSHRVHPHHLCRPEHRGRIVHARRFQSPC